MVKPRIVYQPRADATPETERDALGTIIRYVLDCSERKKAAPASRPDDAKEITSVRAKTIIPNKS